MTISLKTRQRIFDALRSRPGFRWHGYEEVAFLTRCGFNLTTLPSRDRRFRTMAEDHRNAMRFGDWSDDWVYSDDRLNLNHGSDEVFLRFLCAVLHPLVRPDVNEAKSLQELFNQELAVDGWKVARQQLAPGQAVYEPQATSAVSSSISSSVELEVLSTPYVREMIAKCEGRLDGRDFDGAISSARTLVEAVLNELEIQLEGACGKYADLAKQYRAVAKKLRVDPERADLDQHFKQVVGGLLNVVDGLAPIRNKASDAHARVRKPEAHHAHLVVNAAKTLATFLVESFVVQRERGLLPPAPGSAA